MGLADAIPFNRALQHRGLLYEDLHSSPATTLLLPLAKALAGLSHTKRDLILLTANALQYDLTVNVIASLAAVGLRNYLLLADDATLVRHAARRGAVACAWSSALEQFTASPNSSTIPACACARPDSRSSSLRHVGGLRDSGAGPVRCAGVGASGREADACTPSAARFYRADAVRRLWILRVSYASRLLTVGYHVMLLDSDSLVFANPYPLIHAHLSEFAAIGLGDVSAWPQMQLNGGTWYFAPRARGPVHGMLRSFVRRVFSVLRAYPEQRFFDASSKVRRLGRVKPADFLLFDQTMLNLALLEAALGRRVDLNSSEQLTPIGKHSATRGEQRRVEWKPSCCYAAPDTLGHPPWRTGAPTAIDDDAGRPARRPARRAAPAGGAASAAASLSLRRPDQRRESLIPYGRATQLRRLELPAGGHDMRRGRTDAHDSGEVVIQAPQWLFSAESDAFAASGRAVATFWGATPPPAAVVHFVCSSWPGSDGRRAAMRLWGHWHSHEVEAEAVPSAQRTYAMRRRGFVSFASAVDAKSPQELEPYLRLLTLAAFATRRTPVLPLMRCDGDAQRWVDERVDPRSGERVATGNQASPRPCGWAVHSLGGERLPAPLCVQRPLEGCFLAFATPNELAPHLPTGYWSGEARRRCAEGGAACAWAREVDVFAGRAAANLTTGTLVDRLQPYCLPPMPPPPPFADTPQTAPIPRPPSLTRRAEAVLLLNAPRRAAMLSVPMLASPPIFNEALASAYKALGVASLSELMKDRGLTAAWYKCLKMVRANKCAAVC